MTGIRPNPTAIMTPEYSKYTTAWLASRFPTGSTKPKHNEVLAINTFFRDAVAGGWLSKIKAAWFFGFSDETVALKSFIGSLTLSKSSAGTVTKSALGYSTDGTASYLTTGGLYGAVFSDANNFQIDVWALTNVAANSTKKDFGVATASLNLNFSIKSSSSSGVVRPASATTIPATSNQVTSSIGHFGFNRTNNVVNFLKNGSFYYSTNDSVTSPAFPTGSTSTIALGTGGGSGSFIAQTYSWFALTLAMTATEYASYYSAIRRLMLQLGIVAGTPPKLYYDTAPEGTKHLYRARGDGVGSTVLRWTPSPWQYIGQTGESTSVGVQGDTGPVVVVNAPITQGKCRAMMLERTASYGYGVRGRGNILATPLVDYEDVEPAFEQITPNSNCGETGITAGMNWHIATREVNGDDDIVFVQRTFGVGGADIRFISPARSDGNPASNTISYNSGLAELAIAQRVAKLYGTTIECKAIMLTSGANDILDNPETTAADFINSMNVYVAQTQTDWKAVLGSTKNIIFYITQCATAAGTKATTADPIQIGQVSLARTNPLIRCWAPRYQLLRQSTGNPHNQPKMYILEQENFHKVLRTEWAGTTFHGLGTWIDVSRNGNLVTIVFWKDQAKTVPWNNLQWNVNDTLESLAPTYGWNFDDDTHTASAISAAIVSYGTGVNNAVVVTLSAVPTGSNMYIGYAWIGPGAPSNLHSAAWGNLSDSDPTMSVYYPASNLWNWCNVLKEPLS